MTVVTNPPPTDMPVARPRRRMALALVVALFLAGGLGAGLAFGLGGNGGPSGAPGSASSPYAYYQSMLGRYGGRAMMGGSYGWMAGSSGFSWMYGGTGAPGWMAGGSLPGFMMGGTTDPGQAMGRFWADAPGPRVSEAEATSLGNQVPAGAVVDEQANSITFSGGDVRFAVEASPSMPAESFRVAGMTNPTVVVPLGAKVTIELVNADEDMAHGLVVTTAGAASSYMPMMSVSPAFDGAALWFLGESTSAGMHEGTLTFTADTAGSYQYLCPVPGHAQQGMVGAFVVSG